MSGYPGYHTGFETFDLVDRIYDPEFKVFISFLVLHKEFKLEGQARCSGVPSLCSAQPSPLLAACRVHTAPPQDGTLCKGQLYNQPGSELLL